MIFTRIANAGIAQVKPLLELTEEDFHRMFVSKNDIPPSVDISAEADKNELTLFRFSRASTSTASKTASKPPQNNSSAKETANPTPQEK